MGPQQSAFGYPNSRLNYIISKQPSNKLSWIQKTYSGFKLNQYKLIKTKKNGKPTENQRKLE